MDENVAFVGSRSYKTLEGWVDYLELDRNDVFFVNASKKLGRVTLKDLDEPGLFRSLAGMGWDDKVVCLGNYADKAVKKINKVYDWTNVMHYVLPHPSGLNRKLNNKEYVKEMLDKCKEFLNAKSKV